MTTIRAFFTPNQGNFLEYLKNGRGDPPPLPSSSYVPANSAVKPKK